MKFINKLYTLSLVALFLFGACDKRELMYDTIDPNSANLPLTYNLGSPNPTVVVKTDVATTTFEIAVVVWGGNVSQDISIPFEVTSTTLPEGALIVEGGGFVIAKGTNSGSIKLVLNRDIVTPGIVFTVKYKMGTPSVGEANPLASTGTITTFNPGPLAPWVGTYVASAASYGDPGNWDEEWGNVSTALNPVDPLNSILIKGIAGASQSIIATINVTAKTVTIKAGQVYEPGYGYGNFLVVNSDYNNFLTNDDLVGTVDDVTGEMKVDYWGAQNESEGWLWDAFNVTFKKSGKKSADLSMGATKSPKTY